MLCKKLKKLKNIKALTLMINYLYGWFDISQLPKKLEEEVEDVFIADGSINGLTNYAVFTVPVSLNITENMVLYILQKE